MEDDKTGCTMIQEMFYGEHSNECDELSGILTGNTTTYLPTAHETYTYALLPDIRYLPLICENSTKIFTITSASSSSSDCFSLYMITRSTVPNL